MPKALWCRFWEGQETEGKETRDRKPNAAVTSELGSDRRWSLPARVTQQGQTGWLNGWAWKKRNISSFQPGFYYWRAQDMPASALSHYTEHNYKTCFFFLPSFPGNLQEAPLWLERFGEREHISQLASFKPRNDGTNTRGNYSSNDIMRSMFQNFLLMWVGSNAFFSRLFIYF